MSPARGGLIYSLGVKDAVVHLPRTEERFATALLAVDSLTSALSTPLRAICQKEQAGFLRGFFPDIEEYSGEDADCFIDLSLPPEQLSSIPRVGVRVTANPANFALCNVHAAPGGGASLPVTLGLAISTRSFMPQDEAIKRAEAELSRAGFFTGRRLVFYDTDESGPYRVLLKLFGPELLAVGPKARAEGVVGLSSLPALARLAALSMCELYVGGQTLYAGFSYLYGVPGLLSKGARPPEDHPHRRTGWNVEAAIGELLGEEVGD